MPEPHIKPSNHGTKIKNKNKKKRRRKRKHNGVPNPHQDTILHHQHILEAHKSLTGRVRARAPCDTVTLNSVHNATAIWRNMYETTVRWQSEHQNNYWRNLAEQRKREIHRLRDALATVRWRRRSGADAPAKIESNGTAMVTETTTKSASPSPSSSWSSSTKNQPSGRKTKRKNEMGIADGKDETLIIDQSYVDFMMVTQRHRADLALQCETTTDGEQ